jgi:hypothetical protein
LNLGADWGLGVNLNLGADWGLGVNLNIGADWGIGADWLSNLELPKGSHNFILFKICGGRGYLG